MIYITEADLKTDSYERFINESTQDFPEVKDKAEAIAVGLVRTLLKGRYDVATIFNATQPVRDEVLVDIITKITLYKIFGRNAARKVPSDVKEDYEHAMKLLEKLNSGKVTLDLPSPTDADGNVKSTSIWGNNSNPNFYI